MGKTIFLIINTLNGFALLQDPH